MYKGRAAHPYADKQGQHEGPIRYTMSPRSGETEGTHAVDNVQLSATNNDYNLPTISECLCLHISVNLHISSRRSEAMRTCSGDIKSLGQARGYDVQRRRCTPTR